MAIGWGGFANYEFTFDEQPSVSVTIDDITDDEAVLAFALSVLPMALPMFDLEPFHGSAIKIGDEALILLGAQGGGKSSTAAALHTLGYASMTDDTCAIDGDRVLWPGPPLISPRDDTASQPIIGRYNNKHLRSIGDGDVAPAPVGGVVILHPEPGSKLHAERLSAAAAFPMILGNARHAWFLEQRRRSMQFHVATMLSRLPVSVLTYDAARSNFGDVANEILLSVADAT
jgi:hypothetical protein